MIAFLPPSAWITIPASPGSSDEEHTLNEEDSQIKNIPPFTESFLVLSVEPGDINGSAQQEDTRLAGRYIG
jgi:hypothetical protein